MSQVQGDAGFGECIQKREGRSVESALGTGTVSPGIGTEMSQADRTQALLPPPLNLIGAEYRIGAFHAQDQADRGFIVGILPGGDRVVEILRAVNKANLSRAFERFVIMEMRLADGMGGFLRSHAVV